MLGRTSALIRSSLSNSIRHGSHGGIPGPVSIRVLQVFGDYKLRNQGPEDFSVSHRPHHIADHDILFVAELAVPAAEQVPPDGLVHLLLRIRNRPSFCCRAPPAAEGLIWVRLGFI